MDKITNYIYAVLWFAIAVFLIVQAKKLSKWLYLLSVYFLYLTGWYLANEFTGGIMFSGVCGWIFRAVSLTALVIFALVYFLGKKSAKNKNDEHDDKN